MQLHDHFAWIDSTKARRLNHLWLNQAVGWFSADIVYSIIQEKLRRVFCNIHYTVTKYHYRVFQILNHR